MTVFQGVLSLKLGEKNIIFDFDYCLYLCSKEFSSTNSYRISMSLFDLSV